MQVYREAVESDRCSAIHLTHVEAEPECDTFFPDIKAAGAQLQALLTCYFLRRVPSDSGCRQLSGEHPCLQAAPTNRHAWLRLLT